MCGFCLLLLRMHSFCRLLPDESIDKEADSYKDERNAEPLSHIQDHILLEAHLRFLDELYEETHSEKDDEEYTDEGSPVDLVQSELVKADEDNSEKSVAQSLIKLGRMFRESLAAKVEDEAPRKICDIAVDLGIAEVSKPDEHGCKTYRKTEMVKNPYEIKIVLPAIMPCKPDHCNKQSNCSSMAGQSSLPRHEDLPEALPASEIVIRLIEDAVTQTRSDDGTYQECIEKRIQERLRNILPSEEPSEDIPSEYEAGNEQKSVPAERKSTDVEDLRIHAPMYCQCFKHMPIYKNKSLRNSQASYDYLRTAAIPGSSLPSRYSSIAPPPVET